MHQHIEFKFCQSCFSMFSESISTIFVLNFLWNWKTKRLKLTLFLYSCWVLYLLRNWYWLWYILLFDFPQEMSLQQVSPCFYFQSIHTNQATWGTKGHMDSLHGALFSLSLFHTHTCTHPHIHHAQHAHTSIHMAYSCSPLLFVPLM